MMRLKKNTEQKRRRITMKNKIEEQRRMDQNKEEDKRMKNKEQ